MTAIRSALIWFALASLVLLWLPLLWLISVFDRDPVRYRTGRWFRRLGIAMTKVNPNWRLHVGGHTVENPRNPYVVVSNHQSMADIPLISHLPWEMKWIGKIELFRIPVIGWMMKIARDIPVNRSDPRSGARTLIAAARVLAQKCSVIIFPEGTRSLDGKVGRFSDGAFHLAISAGVPILPVVVEGSHGCLPKKSWKFQSTSEIRVEVLPPVDTKGYTKDRVGELKELVRNRIIETLSAWRGVPPGEVDAAARTAGSGNTE